MTLWKCQECSAIFKEEHLLTDINPFDFSETITGCPRCHAVDSFIWACDEKGCTDFASSGIPSDKGYRTLCPDHAKKFREDDND